MVLSEHHAPGACFVHSEIHNETDDEWGVIEMLCESEDRKTLPAFSTLRAFEAVEDSPAFAALLRICSSITLS